MFSLEGLIKRNEKTNMVFRNEEEEKKTQKTEQEQVKGFQNRALRVSKSQKMAQIASGSLTDLFVSGSMFDATWSPETETSQAFRAAFLHKTDNGVKAKRSIKGRLVTASIFWPPISADFCFSENLATERPKCPEVFGATFPHRPREKKKMKKKKRF